MPAGLSPALQPNERPSASAPAAASNASNASNASTATSQASGQGRSPASSHEEPSQDWFRRFAHRVSCIAGKAGAFCAALAAIIVWGVTGPLFHFSDTWQLVINTSTTIVTFLMVFLIQSTQNRDANAIHLKLDELIRATHNARNGMLALEQLSDAKLEDLEQEFERLRNVAVEKRANRPSRPEQAPENV